METLKFENLDVWKRAARLSAEIFKGLKDLKDYGFKDQLTRSGLSIPSNIAEGIERSFPSDCVKFLLKGTSLLEKGRSDEPRSMKKGGVIFTPS